MFSFCPKDLLTFLVYVTIYTHAHFSRLTGIFSQYFGEVTPLPLLALSLARILSGVFVLVYSIFTYVSVYAHTCMSLQRVQKRASDPGVTGDFKPPNMDTGN